MAEQDEHNPFAAPQSDLRTPGFDSVEGSPTYKLFSSGQATWATFLGTPVAGCSLIALNYSRLGQHSLAIIILIFGLIASTMTLILNALLTGWIALSVIFIGSLLGVYCVTEKLQGSDFRNHLASGGRRASSWAATGIGLVVVFLLIVAMTFLLQCMRYFHLR